MSSLFDLTGEYLSIMDMLEDGEVDEQLILYSWEAIEGEFNLKAEAYAKIMKNLQAQSNSLKVVIDELTKKKKTLENRQQRLKDAMFNSMKALDLKEAGTDIFKIKIQKNGGRLPIVLDVEPEALPWDLRVVEVKADNEALREYIINGGTEYAHFGEAGESLRIK